MAKRGSTSPTGQTPPSKERKEGDPISEEGTGDPAEAVPRMADIEEVEVDFLDKLCP